MLLAAGTVLEVDKRIINGPTGAFEQVTVSVLTGKADIERLRLGRDYDARVPGEGQIVVLEVVASAYSGRNGAGLQLTALRDRSEEFASLVA